MCSGINLSNIIVRLENLIVTYDDKYGNLNLNVIRSEIENKLLAR